MFGEIENRQSKKIITYIIDFEQKHEDPPEQRSNKLLKNQESPTAIQNVLHLHHQVHKFKQEDYAVVVKVQGTDRRDFYICVHTSTKKPKDQTQDNVRFQDVGYGLCRVPIVKPGDSPPSVSRSLSIPFFLSLFRFFVAM